MKMQMDWLGEYPKKTNFNNVPNTDIEILKDDINNMPRKIFNSAIQMYASELSQIDVTEKKQ